MLSIGGCNIKYLVLNTDRARSVNDEINTNLK